MGALTGLLALGTYPAAALTTAGDKALVQATMDAILLMIPDPDTAPAQGGGNALDEMHPGAAAQLRVEVAAMRAAVTGP